VRVLVISDIHGNLVALQTVLRAAGTVEAIWCLGDTVGYGPEPEACVQALRELPHVMILGNHDSAAIGSLDLEQFNLYAAAAARWTADQLSDETRQFLAGLPLRQEAEGFTLAHGSPRDPLWEYLLDTRSALANLEHFTTHCCLVGHTHLPAIFRSGPARSRLFHAPDGTELDLSESDTRFILNPGSVGQPRDHDPRAAYLMLDTSAGQASWHRVEYDVRATQRQMEAHQLPRRLIERLTQGW
jgi:diadenosine tetraphosphatase ApaH/serine/threonine PP2A family protein phosphatase